MLAVNLVVLLEWVTQALADQRYRHRKGRYQVNFAELLSVLKNRFVHLHSLPDRSELLLYPVEQAVRFVE